MSDIQNIRNSIEALFFSDKKKNAWEAFHILEKTDKIHLSPKFISSHHVKMLKILGVDRAELALDFGNKMNALFFSDKQNNAWQAFDMLKNTEKIDLFSRFVSNHHIKALRELGIEKIELAVELGNKIEGLFFSDKQNNVWQAFDILKGTNKVHLAPEFISDQYLKILKILGANHAELAVEISKGNDYVKEAFEILKIYPKKVYLSTKFDNKHYINALNHFGINQAKSIVKIGERINILEYSDRGNAWKVVKIVGIELDLKVFDIIFADNFFRAALENLEFTKEILKHPSVRNFVKSNNILQYEFTKEEIQQLDNAFHLKMFKFLLHPMFSIEKLKVSTAQYILETGYDPYSLDKFKNTALHIMICKDYHNIIKTLNKRLLEKDIEVFISGQAQCKHEINGHGDKYEWQVQCITPNSDSSGGSYSGSQSDGICSYTHSKNKKGKGFILKCSTPITGEESDREYTHLLQEYCGTGCNVLENHFGYTIGDIQQYFCSSHDEL